MVRNSYYVIFWVIVCSFWTVDLLAQKDDEIITNLKANVKNTGDSLKKAQYLNELAYELSEINPKKSLEYAQSALKISQKLANQEAQASSLLQIGNAHYHLNQFTKAQTSIEEARKLCESLDYQTGLTDCYNNLAKVSLKTGNRKQAYQYIGKARQIAETHDYPIGLASAYQHLGDWLLQEDSEQALNTYEQALQIFELNGQPRLAANTLSKIADYHEYEKKDYQTAIQYRQQAMQLYETLDEERSLAANFNAIGNTYLQAKQPKQALQQFFQGYVLAREYEFLLNGEHLAKSMQGIGQSYATLARNSKKDSVKQLEYQRLAQYYLKEAQSLQKKDFNLKAFNQERYRTLLSNANPGPRKDNNTQNLEKQKRLLAIENERLRLEKLAQNKQIDRLEALRQKALLRAKEDSLQIQKLDSQLNLMAQTQEQKESQISSLQQENVSKEKTLVRQEQQIWTWIILLGILLLCFLGIIWWRRRRHHRQLSYEQEKLKVSNERVNRQEVSLRDKEDVIHKKEQKLAATLAQLDESRYEQEAMIQMLQDEFNPNLNVIVQEAKQPEINRLVIHQSGKQMLNLVEQIAQVSQFKDVTLQLYQSEHSLQKIADQALSEHTALATYKQIRLEHKVPAEQMVYADADVLTKVLDALIYNTVKYSPNKGQVILQAQNKKEFTEIWIEDNGKTVPNDLLKQVFNQYNVEEARPSGMGLPFAKMMIEAHEGKIWLESSASVNKFYLQLPLQPESTTQPNQNSPKVSWLSSNELQTLQPFIFRIRQLEIYETTSIKSALHEIKNDSPGIQQWKNEIETAIYKLDEKRFQKLINV